MKPELKIIIGAALALFIGIAVASFISNAKIRSLERSVEAAKQQAEASEKAASDAETRAAEYKQKTEYLESQIARVGEIARRQDEELEKINADSGRARRDVERARSVRSIDATADELCAKLAELGHGCR